MFAPIPKERLDAQRFLDNGPWAPEGSERRKFEGLVAQGSYEEADVIRQNWLTARITARRGIYADS